MPEYDGPDFATDLAAAQDEAYNDTGEPRSIELAGRRYHFRQVPDHVLWHPELTPAEVMFYMKLMFFAANRKACTYSIPFLAAACGVSERSIQNYESRLEKLGLLVRQFRKDGKDPRRNDNNVLAVIEEPLTEPKHAFRHAEVVKDVKAEMDRRKTEAKAKKTRPAK